MRHTFLQSVVVAMLCLVGTTSFAQTGQQRGATLGGLAGAVAGAVIGDNNNEAGAGAAIGTVVGAVAGGILGNASDKEAAYARQQQYHHHQQVQRQQQLQQVAVQQSSINIGDVVTMSRSGLSDTLIINQIQHRGFGSQLSVQDIIAMHQYGVSEHVISALQNAPSPHQIGATQTIVQSPPIVVQQPVVKRSVIVQSPVVHHRIVPSPVIVTPRIATPYKRSHHRSRGGGGGIHLRF